MALKDRFGSMGLFAVRDNNEIINLAEHFLELNSDAGAILTTTPLGGGASYTQAGQDRLNRSPVVNRVKGEVWADQAGTLYLEESENNSTWTATRTVAVSAGITAQVPWTILTKRYFRFRYVNGATAQTGFILVQQTGGPGMRNTVLTGSLPAGTNEIGTVKTYNRITPTNLVNTSTIIAVGGFYASAIQTETVGRELSIDLRFSAAVKFKIQMEYLSSAGSAVDTLYDVVLDNSATAKVYDAVRFVPKSPRYIIKVLNSDVADITLINLNKVVWS